MKSIILILTIFITGCLSIAKMPSVKGDGFNEIANPDLVIPSQIKAINELDSLYTFNLINYGQIIEAQKEPNDILFILSAVNCGYSERHLTNVQKLYDFLRNEKRKVNVICLYENISPEYTLNVKKTNHYNFPLYFIKDQDNSQSYLTKRKAFYKELMIPDYLFDSLKPLNIYYSSKNNTYTKKRGMIPADSLISLIK